MLEVKGLKKQYGSLFAVKGISFDLQPGEIFGFIGSNGAGKTTTIKMIATLLEPSAGTAILNGVDLLKDPMGIRRQIGYMPDFFGLYDDVKVWEYLDFFCSIYAVPPSKAATTIGEVLELTNLSVKRDSFVSSLSRGMQQRLCLARCLVHDPMLLLLDEPASGLDPRARAELKDLIAELGRMGKIVLVSSHILPELADFCTTVGIIEKGEMLAFGPVRDVVKGIDQSHFIAVRLIDDAAGASMFLQGQPGVVSTNLLGSSTFKVEFIGGPELQAGLLQMLLQQGHRVLEFREEGADLEDVFMKITTGAVQ